MNSKNRKFVIIDVDCNDGDTLTSINEVTEEQILALTNVAKAIQNFEPYEVKDDGMTWKHDNNFPTGEMCREDLGQKTARDYYVKMKKTISPEDFEVFMNVSPFGEYGFHTVERIRLLAVIGEIRLL